MGLSVYFTRSHLCSDETKVMEACTLRLFLDVQYVI